MKRFLALLLILSIAVATPGLTKDDFEVEVIQQKTQQIIVKVANTGDVSAYNVVVRFNAPQGVEAEATTTINRILPKKESRPKWDIIITDGEPDFSNAFELLSWDDSVALQTGGIPTETEEGVLTITGTTDTGELCQKMQEEEPGKDVWTQTENCNVLVSTGDHETYANDDGTFELVVPLEEGENKLTITATDPGSNTNTQDITVTYAPTIADTSSKVLEENLLVFAIAAIIGLIVVAVAVFFVLKKFKPLEQKQEQVVTQTKELVGAGQAQTKLESLHESEKQFAYSLQRSGMGGGGGDLRALSTKYMHDTLPSIIRNNELLRAFVVKHALHVIKNGLDVDQYVETVSCDPVLQGTPILLDKQLTTNLKMVMKGRYLTALKNEIKLETGRLPPILEGLKTAENKRQYLIEKGYLGKVGEELTTP